MTISYARSSGPPLEAQRLTQLLRAGLGVACLVGGTGLVVLAFPLLVVDKLAPGIALVVLGAVLTRSRRRSLFDHLAVQWSTEVLDATPGWTPISVRSGDGHPDLSSQVVRTPGGVLAVATTFRPAAGTRSLVKLHERDLAAARLTAQRVGQALEMRRVHEERVVPVLMVWGTHKPALPKGYRIDSGVFVVDGDRPDTWRGVLSLPAEIFEGVSVKI